MNERRHWHLLAASASCPLCPRVEDVDHILIGCYKVREVWDSFSFLDGVQGVDDLLDSRLCSPAEATVATAIAWNIWKHRNTKIFDGVDKPLLLVRQRCTDDVWLWANQCTKEASRMYLINWWHSFDPP
jgi:hypothetical protein